MPYTKMLSGVEGAKTINKKGEFGYRPLADQLPRICEIVCILKANGIGKDSYSLLGGACLALELPIPKQYARERPTSNLIELTIERWRTKAASEALVRKGWQPEDPKKYFAIEFTLNGIKNLICTVSDEEMLCKDSAFVALVPIPTSRYIAIGNEIRRGELKELETPGRTLMHKLLRGTDKDKKDIVSVASVTSLDPLFSSEKARRVLENYVRHHGFNHVKKTVGRVIDTIREEGALSKLAEHNVAVLNLLARNKVEQPTPLIGEETEGYLESASLATLLRSASPPCDSKNQIAL